MWDERVPVHLASAFYDLDGFRASQDALRDFEIDEVGDVAGKRLLHLQCHIGTDTLSWVRRGAVVTGLDFSARAVAAAQDLAAQLGLQPQQALFVYADVYDAPTALAGQAYDIVYTGLGALCWLPDLVSWARIVTSLLVPGGFLYLSEFHPVGLCLSPAGTSLAGDYFEGDAIVVDEPGTYADRDARTRHTRSMVWRHTLGEVISAVAGAGLHLEFLHEFDFTLFEHVEGMVRGAENSATGGGSDAVFRLPDGTPRVPLLYSLRAARA
jgi:SAM-dependent methyltransferase